jgi:hypothetical protein
MVGQAFSLPLEFGYFQAAAPHGWGMLQLAIRAKLGPQPQRFIHGVLGGTLTSTRRPF